MPAGRPACRAYLTSTIPRPPDSVGLGFRTRAVANHLECLSVPPIAVAPGTGPPTRSGRTRCRTAPRRT